MSKERYEIRGKIGQGGVGSVYRAFDTQLNREVAIKRVLADGGHEDQEEATKNLLKEATALSSIQHPNIVTIYDAGIDEDGPYVVMELINGRTLDEMVEENTLTWEDLREIIIQSEEALAAAQNLNLIHRDLKPSNLMVCWLPSGKFQVKIVDFGLAKFSSSPSLQTIDHGDAVFGSIFFMAPEQFERKPLDQRTDLYALGCLFYYALTGKHPFDGGSAAEVMVSHLQHHVTPIREIREDIPQWGADWIMWHIEREMEQRPASAREALEQFMAMENQPATATLTASPVPTVQFADATNSAPKLSAAPVPKAVPTVQMAAVEPTVKMVAAPATIKLNGPVDPSVPTEPLPAPQLTPTDPQSQGTTSAKIKAQPLTKTANTSQNGDPVTTESALGMDSAKKTISNGAKWALISMLIAIIIITGVVGRAYMEKRKIDNLYNEVMKEAKLLNDEQAEDGISKLASNGIQLTEQELKRILNEATSMQENKQKPLILLVLRHAKPEGTYDISTLILNHTLKAKCPSNIRKGILEDVISYLANPSHLKALIDYAKQSSEEDSAAAAIAAMRSCSGDPKADAHVKDLLGLVKSSESPAVRRAAERTLQSIISSSSKKSVYAADLYQSYQTAEDENIKQTMLRILGATGDDIAIEALTDALGSGNPADQNAALSAIGKLGNDELLPILMSFLKNPNNKMMRKDAYKTIDQILRSAPDRDSDTLKGIWTELNATAETDAEKNYMIGGLAMQKYDWAIQLLTPYTKGEDDRIIDYSERAIRKIEKTTKAQPDN
jgi:serine/threonine protein kinase